jgi:lipopolysaccharide export LptBFGC system permease protein LptF
MVTTLDRYIARQFALNYVIAFSVLVSLYVVLDLFFNLDEFYQGTDLGIAQIAIAVVKYYATHLFWYFSQISGVITLFAMAFTLARMQRDNEFVAIISSGVSLYRIALTVIVLGVALNGLLLVDQELIIPRLASKLAQTHKAIALDKPYGVWFLRQEDGSLLSASQFDHKSGVLSDVLLIPSPADQLAETIVADRATWEPDPQGGAGTWSLRRGQRLTIVPSDDGGHDTQRQPLASIRGETGPDEIALRQSTQWVDFLSRSQLVKLGSSGMGLPARIAAAIHNRFSTPIVNMLILIIGVPIFLDRHPSTVVQRGGQCLLICGACFLFAYFCRSMTFKEHVALAAWLPIILLAPIMVIMLDRMKT